MASPSSSSRTNRTSVMERMAPALAWFSTHRYASLGIVVFAGALVSLGIWGSSGSALTADNDEDEIAALGELGDFEADSSGELREKPSRAREFWAEPRTGMDASVPLFDRSSEFDTGIVAATFEGSSRIVNVGPVWLAGTIETDDVLPQADFLPTIPPPGRQAAGPLLIPH